MAPARGHSPRAGGRRRGKRDGPSRGNRSDGGQGERSAAPRGLAQPIVAALAERGRLVVAEPLFGRGRRIALDSKGRGGAQPGELVLVGAGKRGARVVRRLGRPNVARDVLEGLMLDGGLRRSFPRTVESESADAAQSPAETRSRRDLTALPTFTIDPEGARDHDDAISADGEDERARVWVHIADVGAYVRPGGAVDAEALRRGTSVYVPGAVEPMLPAALSNDACSLTPGDDRLAVTVECELAGADVRSVSVYRSVIRSDARLTYPQIDAVFAGRERAAEPWAAPLAVARQVAAALAERRASRHALEIDQHEPLFEFDEEGNVSGVRHEAQTESHRVIEHLMILANEQVAGYLSERKLPAIYRVHEQPDPQAVAFMISQLASLDVPTPPVPDNMSPQQAGEMAADASRLATRHVARRNGGTAIPLLVLRSLKQAYYLPQNIGHAGLASPRYCHFTSPIRRYPDLVVHRALLAGLGLDVAGPRRHELGEIADASSEAERAAMKIERSAADVCSAFLLERRLAELAADSAECVFDGEVAGVIAQGVFVSFGDERFEGFLPARRMRGWWELSPEETMLRCEDSGEALRLGDPTRVTVDRVEAARGRVDLSRAGETASDPRR